MLPSRLPNLLINGSSGIAVGMATNIPPHNLTETISGCLALLANPDITIDELMEIIPAPDFPTAGIIYGLEGVREGYRTGRGRVVIRARTHIEDIDKGGRQAIIVDEIPYQVNKANLLIRIGELVREKKIEGISDLRDESDKSGMRVVIELKRGEVTGDHPQQSVQADATAGQLRHEHGGAGRRPAAHPQPQAVPRVLPHPPARSGRAPHALRTAPGARTRPHPRRPGGRAVQRRRDHRADQGVAHAAGSQGRVDGEDAGARRSSRTC